MLDTELSPAEQRYFESGGQDVNGVLAESDRGRTGPATDYGDDYSPAERAYFQSGGDVTYDLRREHGEAPQQQRENVQLPPAAQAMIDRAIAANRGELLDERVKHAKTSARLELLQETFAPPLPPMPTIEPERPDLMSDIFAYTGDVGQRLERLEQQINVGQREMEGERRYMATLDAAVREEPAVLSAYQHALHSRAMELMAARYPGATVEQLRTAPVPGDIREAVIAEERSIYKSAFEAGRNPVIDIVRLAQARGWQSPQQIAAAKAAQADAERRQREAAAEARRQEEEAEAEWRRGIALKLQYGMSMDELPRADRIRFYRGARVFQG